MAGSDFKIINRKISTLIRSTSDHAGLPVRKRKSGSSIEVNGKVTLTSKKVITGLRQYQTHDIDLVYRKTYEKAYAKFHSSLVEFHVCMVHRKSKYYESCFREQGMRKDWKN